MLGWDDHGGERGEYRILMEKKKQIESVKMKWVNNIKVVLREIDYGEIMWISLAECRAQR
jgi:hypothetical protein